MAYVVIYTVVALGLNILLGYSGLISLGTAGFVGAGALGLGVFMNLGLPLEAAALVVMLISALLGALIGLFSLKVESIYLAIATLFVGEIMRQLYTQVPVFGGEGIRIGEVAILGSFRLNQIIQSHRSILYILMVAAMVVAMILMHNIVKSRTGRALMAMSRSEHAAQAMGISLFKIPSYRFRTCYSLRNIRRDPVCSLFSERPYKGLDAGYQSFCNSNGGGRRFQVDLRHISGHFHYIRSSESHPEGILRRGVLYLFRRTDNSGNSCSILTV